MFCYCCHRWGELLFKENPVCQVLSAGAWDEESGLDVRPLQNLSKSPWLLMWTGPLEASPVDRTKLGKEKAVSSLLCKSVSLLCLQREGGFLNGGSFWVASSPWCMLHAVGQSMWHHSCSLHRSRVPWDPADGCSSKGSLALRLLFLPFLSPYPAALSILPRDLAATPCVCPDINTQGTSTLKKSLCLGPYPANLGKLSVCTAKPCVAFIRADFC